MPKTLLASIGVPPARNGSSFVVGNLIKHFGKGELVVVGEYSSLVTDKPPQEADSPPIYYVSSDWGWIRRGRRFVRWFRWALLPALVLRMYVIAKKEKCDTLIAVFPDELYLLAGYCVSRCARLAFYSYFHNTYLENRSGLQKILARWLQPRVFERSDTVFVITDGMRHFLHARYPNTRFITLVHPCDDAFYCPPARPVLKRSSGIQLGFLGNLNASNIDAMTRFAAVVNGHHDLMLTIHSPSPPRFFRQHGIVGPSIVHEELATADIPHYLSRYDVLLLPHGFDGGQSLVEYKTQFPTRLIAYLVSGRPIVAHCPRDCFLAQWLREHDCAEVVDLANVAHLRDRLYALIADSSRRQALVRNATLAAEQFRASTIARLLRQYLTAEEHSASPMITDVHNVNGLPPSASL